MNRTDPKTDSPCIRMCTLDDTDVCLGCGRSLKEITEWGGADPERRREILEAAARRRATRPGWRD